jgi:signal transduction histidine kinase
MVLEKYQTKYSEEELPLAYEIRGMNKKGESIPLELSVSTYKKKGKVIGIEVIHRDLTERKKAEKERREIMEKVQMMNEKLRVVGGLTRHDVNNKLTALTGNVYLARKKLSGNSEVLDYLKQVEASIEQTVRIFDFAKAYEVLGVEELAYVDVEKTVDEAVSLFPSLKDIKVVNDCHGLTVLADSLLSQLFCNLIDNSLKYGEKTQQIRVYHKKPSADQLEIVYEDDGVGIPDNMRSNLFKEGFTSGKGTGYGLFMIKRICEVYGWTIQETGIQGKGARFTMTIPGINSAGKTNYQTQEPQDHQQESETNMLSRPQFTSAQHY